MNMITVEDLYIKYEREGDMVLDGLSFQVKKGEFVAVVGPADAGKSTLCRALSGLIPHSYDVGISGTINVGRPSGSSRVTSSPAGL
jgi:energy-coupling factor transporter ATP-binding protein EcfA2